MVHMNLFPGQEQRCRHRELVDTVEKGEREMNWESSTDIYTLPYVKWIAGGTCCIAQGAQLGAL